MAVLRALQGTNPGQLFPLDCEKAILGRHPECDIVLESASVSRHHARILAIDSEFHVEDLNSRNGTFVNGQPVMGRQRLDEGDQLSICDLVFVFHRRLPGAPPETEDDLGLPVPGILFDDVRPPSNSTIMSKVDVSAGSTGLRLEVNAEAKLKALIEIAQNLGTALSVDDLLPKLLDSLFKIFAQADRGFVVLRDHDTGRLVPKSVKHRQMDDQQTIRISRTIIGSVMSAKEAILSADAASDSRFDLAESIVDFQIRSMMCAPLVSGSGEALGVIQIDTLDQRSRFSREDLDVLASVACQAAVALENAQLHETALREQVFERDLALAHEVQRGFLPAGSPAIPGYRFFSFYQAARQLGGDYYDYVMLPGNRTAVVVADVSGKGIAASLLMAKFSAETRFCLASEPTPSQAIARLNRVFCGSGWEDRFVTLVLCVLDPARHEVTVVNAGHMPPLLGGAAGDVVPVAEDCSRLPLGVEPNAQYPQAVVPLEPGSCISLYTDGITEAMDREEHFYGEQRLLELLRTGDHDPDRVG
ncbi:MAG: SpoIIE family protein phosphatase, partial [Patescibacteria group bacterium]|nr:SpoIIE family protein phosphatase [Patescibacteria group bacterium]